MEIARILVRYVKKSFVADTQQFKYKQVEHRE
jgi:hypothetical protein